MQRSGPDRVELPRVNLYHSRKKVRKDLTLFIAGGSEEGGGPYGLREWRGGSIRC